MLRLYYPFVEIAIDPMMFWMCSNQMVNVGTVINPDQFKRAAEVHQLFSASAANIDKPLNACAFCKIDS